MSELLQVCQPVLLVEGDGDVSAIPALIRRVVSSCGLHNIVPCSNPIKCGEIPKLRRDGELEKFARYACTRRDGTAVILVVDSDDDCPVDTSIEFTRRVLPIAQTYQKKIGIGFMHREFETLFLYSLQDLAAKYPNHGWCLSEDDQTRDWDEVRGAKGALNRRMKDYSYKETRDQAKFVSAIDTNALIGKCRSLAHLSRMMHWLNDGSSVSLVYPLPP